MPRPRSLACLVLACAALLAPGDAAAREGPSARDVGPDQVARFERALTAFGDADTALAEQRWDDAIAAYATALDVLGDDAVLGGLRDNALYNTACAHARAGRRDRAADAFALSVEHGIRLLAAPTPAGWIARPGLSIPHLLHDPDLDPIRDHAVYRAALDALVRPVGFASAVVGDVAGAPCPVVLVLADAGQSAEDALAPWREAAAGRDVLVAALAPPVRVLEERRDWLLFDGDDRFGADAIATLRRELAADPRVDPSRVYLVSVSPRAGQAAWAAWLAAPDAFAGVMLRGARFHAHWHADAIAALDAFSPSARSGASAPFRVVLGPSDDRAAGLLRDAGIHATRIERGADGVEAARAALEIWVD